VPLLTNSIGQFFFIALAGTPVPPRETVQEEDRPGIVGTEFILTGKKGDRFSLQSLVDCNDQTAARAVLAQYQNLTGQAAVEMVQAGVSATDLGFKVKVLDVQAVDIPPLAGASGLRFSPYSTALLVARWTLNSVPVEEESA